MKIWVIYKIRKDMDSYQASTWRLVSGGNVEKSVQAEVDSLIKRMSPQEVRAGWTYEYKPVECVIEDVSEN